MRQVGLSAMNIIEGKNKEASSSTGNDGGSAVPSGFILKLYQMVNGAPDEVIKVNTIEAHSSERKYRWMRTAREECFLDVSVFHIQVFQKKLSLHMTFNGWHMEVKADMRLSGILWRPGPQGSSICSSLGPNQSFPKLRTVLGSPCIIPCWGRTTQTETR
jgi:hypothetical protein